MNHISFGSVLKEARISKGYELNTVSRRLRIRPDILDAIENSDFDRMPPRGYSRNMINAYARFLGLNANDVTRMYLDESYANQIGRAHQNAIENRYMHRNTSQATSRPGKRQPTNQFKAVSSTRQRVDDGSMGRNGRLMYSDAPEDFDAAASLRARAQARQNRNEDPQLHPARREAIPDGKYVNLYANPSRGMGQAPRGKLPLIIGGAIIVLIVIIIIAVSSCSNKDSDVSNIPVTGIEENEGDGTDQQNAPVAVAPTDFTLSYEVAADKSAYIEVIVDGSTKEAGDVNGGSTETYTSSGTIKFVTSNPENLVLKVDGQEQSLEANSRGVASATYSFNEILNKWYADHPEVTRPASSTPSTSSSSSTSGSSNNATNTSSNSHSSDSSSNSQSSTGSSGSSSNSSSSSGSSRTSD